MGILNIFNTVSCTQQYSHLTPGRIKESLSKETGRDRVFRMFTTNEYGLSPELFFVINAGVHISALSAVYGAVVYVKKAKDDHLRKNVASTYESQHLARRHFTDTMSLSGIRGAIKYGSKYGIFSSLYLLGTMTIANYRNKVSPFEHIATGAVLGSFARINYGLKGFLAAGALGGFLGLVAGGMATVTVKITKATMDDIRCSMHEDYYAQVKRKD